MKQSLKFTLTLLLISTASFAQKNFNQATFDGLMNRYAQNPVKFLKTETAPDFVLAGSDDEPVGLDRVMNIYDRHTQTARQYENVAVRQYGNTGVATGILTHSYVSKASNKPWQMRELFTYVFNSPKPGQWQLVSAQHGTTPSATVADDEAAIKKVIAGVTTSMYARDFKTYLNYWSTAPYVSRVSTDQEGKVTKMTGDEWRKMVEKYATQNLKPSGEKATRDNWLIRVNGNAAFVAFDQHNQYPDGTIRNSVEERYLERVNNEWKLVNVTVLVAK